MGDQEANPVDPAGPSESPDLATGERRSNAPRRSGTEHAGSGSGESFKVGVRMWPFGSIEYAVTRQLTAEVDAARQERESYVERLEAAERQDVFKYVLLINLSALEGYIAQTRIQAQQSFQLSRLVAVVGFALLVVGIVLGVVFKATKTEGLETAYLSSAAGLLTEFISGLFFYLYNRTLSQVNRFHDRLTAWQQVAVAFLATDLVTDPDAGDKAKLALAASLMKIGGAGTPEAPAPDIGASPPGD